MIQKFYDKLPEPVVYAIWRINCAFVWIFSPWWRHRYQRYCANVTRQGRGTFPFHQWLYEVTRSDANRN